MHGSVIIVKYPVPIAGPQSIFLLNRGISPATRVRDLAVVPLPGLRLPPE